MEIAAEHAEGEGVAAGHAMEEGLFLDRIAGEDADVAIGNAQDAVVVESDAADAVAAGFHEASVPAGEAAHGAVGLALDQRLGRRGGELVQHLFQRLQSLGLVGDFQRSHDL